MEHSLTADMPLLMATSILLLNLVTSCSQTLYVILLQAFMGLPVGGGSLPLGFQNVGMLSGLPQMWATAGQAYPGGLMSATQLQELCGSSASTSAAHPVAAAAAASDPQQLAALLRWVWWLIFSHVTPSESGSCWQRHCSDSSFFCWEYILLTLIAYYATAVSSRPKITIEN